MPRTPLLRAIRKRLRTLPSVLPPSSLPADQGSSAVPAPLPPVTRREFLAGAGTLLLGAALPGAAWADRRQPRIAIVGGGIAGLNCALTLDDHGVRSTIYEASPRLGGRMFSLTGYWDEGQVSEWCGELIDTGHKTIRGLAKRFGLPVDNLLEAQAPGSEDTFYFGGRHYPKARFDADMEPVLEAAARDLKAAGYPTTFDSSTPEGRALDALSVRGWIESRVPGGMASDLGQLLDVAYNIEYGAETTDQSSLNLLYLLAYQGDPHAPAVFGESDEAYHIAGGNERLPRAIAAHLGMDRFVTGRRLVKLAQTATGPVRLGFQSAQGLQEVEADLVVLALPFSALREVDLSQAGFDALKLRAIRELGNGRNAKTQLQFRRRVWAGTGAWPGVGTGSSYSDTGYQSGWEVTRAQAGSSGILNFYSGGDVTGALKAEQPFASAGNAAARRDAEAMLAAGEPVFPGLSAEWNGKFTQSIPHLSPFFRASYAYYRVGQYAAFGGYEGARQGRVFFAGDHCSRDFQGYMEGGASEGARAAGDVLGFR